MIKFLCKDLWTLIFRKQIDNLKTNHRVRQKYRSIQRCFAYDHLPQGVYVLTDNSFKPFTRMSMASSLDAVHKAQAVSFLLLVTSNMRLLILSQHLWFPCGVIRGSLASMGLNATVQAETSDLPAATFQIRTIATKP